MSMVTKNPDGTFKYGTLEEAERRQAERVKKRKMTLCPLTRATCSADCVCYISPVVTNVSTEENPAWDCRGGHCDCYMLVGPE